VPGDRITIGDVDGVVDEISARTVRILTPDARRVHYPNRAVLDGAITNLSAEGRRMATFVVGAAYDTDLEAACEEIERALAATETVLSDPAPRAYVQEFADSTINIACRFWHEPEILAEWTARDEAMRAVKRALDAAGITIAFPQRVVWSAAEAA